MVPFIQHGLSSSPVHLRKNALSHASLPNMATPKSKYLSS
ncbi:hypothetical protein ABEKA_0496 [Acinetobacter lwoffii]|nr:hypothetical protein ABEKA_0496 [Acinetobacter lwoffii]